MAKLKKGKPLTELVKGSLNYTMAAIRSQFYRQHPDTYDEYYYVVEIFEGYIIVEGSALAVDEFYRVTYQQENGRYVFADRDDWEIVELSYQTQTMTERLHESKGERIVEIYESGIKLAEAQPGQPRRIYGTGAFADVVNGNSRRYPLHVLVEATKEARTHLHENLSKGRASLLGEEDHPSSKRQSPRLTETITVWESIGFDYGRSCISLDGRMIENSRGKDAIVTMDAGVLPGLSLRGYGESIFITMRSAPARERCATSRASARFRAGSKRESELAARRSRFRPERGSRPLPTEQCHG
jgi:hypothetical protein